MTPPRERRDCRCPIAQHDHGTAGGYLNDDCRCLRCARWARNHKRARDKREAMGLTTARTRIDPTIARRRLDALVARGWSLKGVARRAGVTERTIECTYKVRQTTVGKDAMIERIYEELWNEAPPTVTAYQKAARTRSLNRAAVAGLVPPMAWDNIDDPTEIPAGAYVPRAFQPSDDVAAEYEHLHNYCGLSDADVAAALGMTLDGLRRALARREDRERMAA